MRSLVAAAAIILPTLAVAQDPKVEKYVLPNGMTVILHEDRSAPIATINTWFRVGSKDEPPRRSGFAHLFEHLMFMGTKRVPEGEFDRIMENAGGSNNASTTEDRTNYYSSGPSNLLPTLLWLDAERLESLGQHIDQRKLDLQRDVVKNERRQSVENSPYGKTYDAVNSLMYPPGHPYAHTVIGSMEDLSAAAVEDVQKFFSSYYVPNNATLVVAGDFDSAKIRPQIARIFGTLPRGNDVPRIDAPALILNESKRMTLVDDVEVPRTMMVWHSPAAYKPGDLEMRLNASVLSDGTASRLYRELVVKQGIATDVSAFQYPQQLGSLFYIEASPAPNVSLDRLEAGIDAVLRDYNAKGPTAEEIERQVVKIERGLLVQYESLDSRADMMNEFDFYLGKPNAFRDVLAKYKSASPTSLRDASANTLDLGRRLVLRTIPKSEPPQFNPRDEKPAIDPPTAYAPALPIELPISGGMKLFYWQRPDLPRMEVRMAFPRGASDDGAAKAGASELSLAMLTEGAGQLNAVEYAAALDRLGAAVGASATQTSTTISLSALSATFPLAVDLFADAVRRPKFDPQDFERLKRLTLSGLEAAESDPGSIAARVGMRELFGANHPYSSPIEGDLNTVSKLTLADVRNEYARSVAPQGAVIYAAGSLTPAAVKQELDRAFAGWFNQGAEAPVTAIPAPANDKLRVVIVDRPGSVQTAIRFYFPSVPYASTNRLPYRGISTILGGSFTSRLNQNLREDKGYTYGASARFSFEPSLGYLVASSDVRTDVTGKSLQEFLNEIFRIRKGDISAEEAAKASRLLRTSTIEQLANLDGILSMAVGLHRQKLSFGSVSDDLKGIDSLTAELMNRLANDSVQLEKAVIVLVGDKAEILKQYQGLGLPEPIEVKPD